MSMANKVEKPAVAPAPRKSREAPLRVVVLGHVDHGKSTLIGRLLYDTDSLPQGKAAELIAVSEKRGVPVEWSFALDSFQAERDQAVTIDTTQIRFSSDFRDYVIIDAPGHREFLKNMVSGAAQADAGVLVVDASEGMKEQTRRHAYLLHLLGLTQIAVVINKMDLAGWSAERFAALAEEAAAYLAQLGLTPSAILPIAAREGDNLASPSPRLSWHKGGTLIEVLDGFRALAPATGRALRFPVQDVYRDGTRRVLVGRVESGVLRPGDELLFSPSNRTARVSSIEAWGPGGAPVEIHAGRPAAVTLDQPVFVERGDVGSHVENAPVLTNVFRASLFWLGKTPLSAGARYKMKLATREANVRVESIERVIDTQTLEGSGGTEVARNGVAEVVLRSRELLALDPHVANPRLGRFVLVEGYDTVGGGVISMKGYPDLRHALTPKATNIHAVDHLLTAEARAERNGHSGAVIWLTGLSGAGKSTLAMRVEKRLFQKGLHCYVLDGDNVRRGLNADLGFSPEERTENIRRIGEVAALMADAGMVVLTAFISPYRDDRRRARNAAPHVFHEVYVKAGVEACAARDPKGLYKKAKAGEIKEFTGISAPYEAPEAPELVIDTEHEGIEDCVARIADYIEAAVSLGRDAVKSGG
jgi:bifunctional enzyme CysN/CysC